jgi:protein AaeX
MPREIDIGGALVPGLLVWFLISMLLLLVFDWIVGRFGLYRYVWHPSLFRLALLVCVFCSGALLFY